MLTAHQPHIGDVQSDLSAAVIGLQDHIALTESRVFSEGQLASSAGKYPPPLVKEGVWFFYADNDPGGGEQGGNEDQQPGEGDGYWGYDSDADGGVSQAAAANSAGGTGNADFSPTAYQAGVYSNAVVQAAVAAADAATHFNDNSLPNEAARMEGGFRAFMDPNGNIVTQSGYPVYDPSTGEYSTFQFPAVPAGDTLVLEYHTHPFDGYNPVTNLVWEPRPDAPDLASVGNGAIGVVKDGAGNVYFFGRG